MAKEKESKERKESSIIRIAGRDINGRYNILRALTQIKGIGYNMANAISLAYAKQHGIKQDTEIGSLSDQDLAKLESVLKEPGKFNVPNFMLNRRKDRETGSDIHLVGTDLTVKIRQDTDNEIRIQTWRGFRKQYGQKVRGQRTRSTGRTGATIGVVKKSVQAPAASSEKKPAA
ncbi:MAG: 30S ribosomal protein S13 [Candidatus Marsarchaeota archaeon]|jgi:small subunit ribosomal protein S13|nr:30S ribosomal protein S13 [Candidatus Marsarchaeota archaeon]